jgi:hypothetical protein
MAESLEMAFKRNDFFFFNIKPFFNSQHQIQSVPLRLET